MKRKNFIIAIITLLVLSNLIFFYRSYSYKKFVRYNAFYYIESSVTRTYEEIYQLKLHEAKKGEFYKIEQISKILNELEHCNYNNDYLIRYYRKFHNKGFHNNMDRYSFFQVYIRFLEPIRQGLYEGDCNNEKFKQDINSLYDDFKYIKTEITKLYEKSENKDININSYINIFNNIETNSKIIKDIQESVM
ncbi:hypothetical protein CLTEP_26140 [Clostridium tepidiprofundi DSM 19306]|uniref:Uncharacterized protein n=1 Tax=Clostridium tepidiprofundi DSM 19306 TaxID=1121338 RepID=A0A151ASZ5_9CLOT|nr:hypothetical protein [Clostridium tepidiprofundi]KYH30507.1 hypothetical protein CLTEP_26140 [Clostridium tepidiprofundi DSM 19306]